MKSHTRRMSIVPPEIVGIAQSDVPDDFDVVVVPLARNSISGSQPDSNGDSEDGLLSQHETSGTSGETCRFLTDGKVKIVNGIPVRNNYCKKVLWSIIIAFLLFALMGLTFVIWSLSKEPINFRPPNPIDRVFHTEPKPLPTQAVADVHFEMTKVFEATETFEPTETLEPMNNSKPTENANSLTSLKPAFRKLRRNYSETVPPTEFIVAPTVPDQYNHGYDESMFSVKPLSSSGSKLFLEKLGTSFVSSPLGANYMFAVFSEIGSNQTKMAISKKYFGRETVDPLPYLSKVADAVNRSSAFQMKNLIISHDTKISAQPQKYENTTLYFVEPASFAHLKNDIQSQFDFLSDGTLLTQTMFPTADSTVAVNLIDFQMEFETGFVGFWDEGPRFQGLDGERDVTRIIGILQGTRLYTKDFDVITLPMARESYHFFVCVMHKGVIALPEDPDTDEFHRLVTDTVSADPEEVTLSMPAFDQKSLTNYSSLAQSHYLSAMLPLGNNHSENAQNLKISSAYQASQFKLNYKGVNVQVPVDDQLKLHGMENVEADLYNVNKPFYYGIFYKNGDDQAFIYFGAYY